MPDATITSTASTFGTISGVFSADQSTISGTISGIVPGTLTGSVGVPGPAGPGVPAGGTAGQYLQKTSGVDYATDWVTVNLTGLATESWVTAGFYPLTGNPSGFLTASALTPYLTSATAASTYQTLAGMSSYLTTSAAAAGYYPLSGNPSGFLTAASLSGYATESWVTGQGYITSAALTPYLTSATASTTYQTLTGMSDYLAKAGNLAGLANTSTARTNLGLGSLAVVNDAPSDGSQYARKNAAWDVVISGDRYLTTSTTSNTVSNGNKTFTIGTGLSYTPTQNITISYDASNHMHGEVLTYNSGTGVLTVDINHHTGSGTYSAWVVNVGGVTPASSVAWGAITGTLSSQTDLQNALDLKLAATTAATTYATILEPSVDGILTVEPSGSNSATVNVNQDANNYIHLRAGVGQIAMVYGGTTKWFFNDTYLQFPGGTQQTVAYPGSSGFLLKADNLSGLANTGTARTNLGLGTMAVETASNYLTTASASSTYFTIASAANKADLASPTFTGTPTLPTGTIGVTQSPGNNTTALATTAFVTAAVPAFASTAQVVTGTSTTTALAPGNAGFLKADPRLRSLAHISFSRVSGSGVVSSGGIAYGIREMFLGSLATGLAGFSYGWTGLVAVNMSAADWNKVDFSKKIWMSGTAMCGATLGGTNYIGDSNTRNRVSLGGYSSDSVSGDMSVKGIGWKKVGGTSPFFTLTVHNGTTLTDVATSVTQTAGKVINWVIYSDGTGNVTFYIDGTQVATTSAGPTGTSNTLQATYREQVEAVATPTVRAIMECAGGWLYLAD